MNCPKCKTRMYQDTDECRQTHSGSGVKNIQPELVYKCWNCSTRQTIERAPVIQLTAEQMVNRPANSHLKKQTFALIRPFLGSIKLLRSGKKPATWESISNLIRHATGSRIKPETIRKHFEENLQEAA